MALDEGRAVHDAVFVHDLDFRLVIHNFRAGVLLIEGLVVENASSDWVGAGNDS